MPESASGTIPTEREAGGIRIRKYRSDDMLRLVVAVRESVRTVGRWQGWCHSAYAQSDGMAWIEHCISAWDTGQRYEFAIVDAANGGYLGGIGINQRNLENNFANVGYWVRESCHARGVATQATRLAIGFAFDVLGLTRIEIIAAVDNLASRRVAEKTGATLEGIARNRLLLNGAPLPAAVYAMVPVDYVAAQIRAISS
ncbi:MAG: GNAT family N-acetyltransferase [Rudaea sp.]